jgi:hypothetical protein
VVGGGLLALGPFKPFQHPATAAVFAADVLATAGDREVIGRRLGHLKNAGQIGDAANLGRLS